MRHATCDMRQNEKICLRREGIYIIYSIYTYLYYIFLAFLPPFYQNVACRMSQVCGGMLCHEEILLVDAKLKAYVLHGLGWQESLIGLHAQGKELFSVLTGPTCKGSQAHTCRLGDLKFHLAFHSGVRFSLNSEFQPLTQNSKT